MPVDVFIEEKAPTSKEIVSLFTKNIKNHYTCHTGLFKYEKKSNIFASKTFPMYKIKVNRQ